MTSKSYILILVGVLFLCIFTEGSYTYAHGGEFIFQQDTIPADSVNADTLKPYTPTKTPTYKTPYRFGDPFSNRSSLSPLLLADPSTIDMEVEYDSGFNYNIYERIGDVNFRPVTTMTFSEFDQYNNKQITKQYFQERSAGLDGESAVSGRNLIPRLYISPVFDRLFGGSYVDIQPNGFVNLDFGGRFQRTDNPQLSLRQQRNGGFNFDQQISLNLVGKVGEKLAITANFDNNNTFDFQNNLKVEYTGYEEDIVKKIEIGNVSMPVSNSLMTGAQSLFGVKTQLQFGKLFVTSVVSRQQGKSEVLTIESGFQGKEFEVRASEYDENRHFFLGHFFRDNYERWHNNLPQLISGVNITRVEIYVINRNNETETTRQIAAFQDLGEGRVIHNNLNGGVVGNAASASNNIANNLYSDFLLKLTRNKDNIIDDITSLGMVESTDFVKVGTARKLDDSEYEINTQLGYVSLLRKLQNDELLAVSYEYTFAGKVYKVGELTEDYAGKSENEVIFLKMLRPNKIDVDIPSWDLMMKNIYYLNASQVERDGFQLKVRYRDDASGIDNPSLHEGRRTTNIPLIELLKLDQLNQNNDRQKDQNFDYIEGITIDSRNGFIKFPVLEPFGTTLAGFFDDDEISFSEKYVYDALYDNTQNEASQDTGKDKFFITGRYNAGSSSEIALPGINIAEGSVVVTAGNTPLTEGLDYTVDYNLGRVRIINDGILSSGKTINIGYEKADLFNFQARWLYGTRLDYQFNDQFNIGATVMHLNERPGGVTRYQIGDEPTSNTKYGFDINFQEEVPFLTKAMDFLPLVSTKEPSTVTFNAEFAQMVPGTSNIVNGEGTSYIDDFENSVTTIGLDGWAGWRLASTPQTDLGTFTDGDGSTSSLRFNDKRAKVAWYSIDPTVFYRSSGAVNKPSNIGDADLTNHYVRPIGWNEIFRQRSRQQILNFEQTFDIAFYPTERGPYNYNPNLDQTGRLTNPSENWGGIMRAIGNEVDFNKNNVEYIEFWLLDPFIQSENGRVLDGTFNSQNFQGGKLVFNLGNVSEDVIPDNRHSFESGLPSDGDLSNTVMSEWGNVPSEPFLINRFENSRAARENQDVGLDGLDSEAEQSQFAAALGNRINIPEVAQDPSADDFRHFLDSEWDVVDAKVLERYKNFNGMDGNSPVPSGNFPQSSYVNPDNEDLNTDNTISSLEEYFEYEIDLDPNKMVVGQNHIVDEIESENEDRTKWYLFRIPIRDPDRAYNGINSFTNIRFIRMYMTGFNQPVVLRTNNLQLVRSQWRKFDQTLNESGLDLIPEQSVSDFQVSVVNIEGNSTGSDSRSPYVVPPGVNRDQDNTTIINRELNEQSLQVCVEDLKDKDARAVFKNVSFDLLNYGQLKMYFHAESFAGDVVQDDEVTGFLRLGTDRTEHYYEIEIPLKVTPAGVGATDPNVARLVWPEENEIDIPINQLLGLKAQRNKARIDIGREYKGVYLIDETNPNRVQNITVKGNPDISTIQVMMIGVRNPESTDQATKSVCIWANEMRVTDFDTRKGWAANARISTKLADVATINASTRYTSIGFGTIQQTIQQRSREETLQYDVSANVNVDKFLLPHKTGLVVPMFVSYEKSTSTPQFDPLDPDTPLEASLESFNSNKERSDYRRLVEERSERRSINFTNVRKNKVNPEANPHFFDVENLSFSYAYSEAVSSNVNTQVFIQKSVSGGLGYNYSPISFTIEPFAKTELFSSPYLKLIKDINFSPLPTSLSFRTDLNRSFRKTQLYNDELTTENIEPSFEKLFTFTRNYGLGWSPFKSLNFDYSARANAVIDEPDYDPLTGEGIRGDINTGEEKKIIWNQVKDLGRMKNFDQDVSVTYRTPLDKLPFTDWLSADVRYAAGYTWTAGSLSQNDDLGNFFGHTIANSRDRGLNGKVDLNKLYNKVTFLEEASKQKRDEKVSFGNGVLKFLMAVQNVNLTYNIREGTTLPGFTQQPFLLGLDSTWNAPGWKFLAGDQDPNIRYRAARNGWVSESLLLTTPFEQTKSTDVGIRTSIEPLRDLKIQLDATRTNSGSFQEIFRFDTLNNPSVNNGFASLTPARSGSYSITFMSIKTAFVKNRDDNSSATFDQFIENIETIRRRQNSRNPDGNQYDSLSQDVLIPAFLAAYSGQDANESKLSPFPKIPIPNWRIDYSGLIKIPFIEKYFSSFTISHGYRSIYNVNNYTNSLLYSDNITLDNSVLDYPRATKTLSDTSNTLVPVYIVNQVTISEQFSPLIGINVRTKNNITTRMEYKKERNLSLNMSNAQITETLNNDFTFDFGFTKSDFKLPFKIKGRTVGLENDVTFRMAMTIRDATTIQRKLEGENKVTNGNTSFQFRPAMTYKLNDQLDLTAYFDRSVNEPKISAFKTATTAFGFQLRFSLAQ
ncbi:MAG: cell surface protein SprA [Cyclobacteriaceae bacterium]